MKNLISARLRQAKREEVGFTLIELLVVIAVLATLAGIVVFSVGGITERGKESACKSEIATLHTAQEANFAQLGVYADSAVILKDNGFVATTPSWYDTNNTGAVVAKASRPSECETLPV